MELINNYWYLETITSVQFSDAYGQYSIVQLIMSKWIWWSCHCQQDLMMAKCVAIVIDSTNKDEKVLAFDKG